MIIIVLFSFFQSLQSDCLVVLYNSLPHLIKCLSPEILNSFLENGSTDAFATQNVPQCSALLRGLSKALLVKDPPESVTAIIYQAVGFIYKLLPTDLHVGVPITESSLNVFCRNLSRRVERHTEIAAIICSTFLFPV